MTDRINNNKYLKFHLPLNGHINDVSGNNISVTSANLGYAKNQFGKTAGSFNGSSSGIIVNEDLSTYKSLSFNIRILVGLVNRRIFQGIYDSPNFFHMGVDANGKIFVYVSKAGGTSAYLDSAISLNDGVDHHIALTFVEDNLELYIDGELDSIDTTSVSTPPSLSFFTIGYNHTGSAERLNGLIYNFRGYNIELTGEEVNKLYKQSQNVPRVKESSQPLDLLPDIMDSTLEAAWLNKSVTYLQDYSNNQRNCAESGDPSFVHINPVGFSGWGCMMEYIADTDFTETYPITLYSWIKIKQESDNGISHFFRKKHNTGPWQSWTINWTDSTNKFAYAITQVNETIKVIYSDVGYELGEWHHVVTTLDSDKLMKLYIDGELQTDTDTVADIYDSNSSLMMGADGNHHQWSPDQEMKDVRVYSEAKSAEWIATEYSNAVPDSSLMLRTCVNGTDDRSRFSRTTSLEQRIIPTSRGVTFLETNSTFQFNDSDLVDLTTFTTGTFSTWFNQNTIPGGNNHSIMYCVLTDSPWQNLLMYIDNSDNKLKVTANGTADSVIYVSTNALLANKFYHLIFTWDGTYGYVYLDGVLVKKSSFITFNNGEANPAKFVIGNSGGISGSMAGEVSDFRFYNEYKDKEWIEQLYNSTKQYY